MVGVLLQNGGGLNEVVVCNLPTLDWVLTPAQWCKRRGEEGGWRRRWSASQLWRSTLLSRTQTKKKDSQRVFLTEVGWLFHTHPFINMRLVKSMVLINVTTFTKKRNKIKYWEYQYQPCGHVQVHHGKKNKKTCVLDCKNRATTAAS